MHQVQVFFNSRFEQIELDREPKVGVKIASPAGVHQIVSCVGFEGQQYASIQLIEPTTRLA